MNSQVKIKVLKQEVKDIRYLKTVLKKYPAFGKKRDIKNLNHALTVKNKELRTLLNQ